MSGSFSRVSMTDGPLEVGSARSSGRAAPPIVLVADGDEAQRSSTAQLLSARGYRTMLAGTGEAALAAIVTGDIHLVVCAVAMPRMDGLELLRVLRDIAPDLPVIALAAGMTEIDGVYIRGAMALGAARAFTQPLTPSVFLASVCELVGDIAR